MSVSENNGSECNDQYFEAFAPNVEALRLAQRYGIELEEFLALAECIGLNALRAKELIPEGNLVFIGLTNATPIRGLPSVPPNESVDGE